MHCSVQSRCYATTERWVDIPGSFLANGSVSTFPQQQTRKQLWKSYVYYAGPCQDITSKGQGQA
jgi:hypothetical protein